MKCKWCDKEFESKRADARFCSDKCRKAYKRKADKVSEIRRKSDKVSEIIKADKETDTGPLDEDLEQMSIIDGDILDMMPRLLCPGPLDVYSEQRWAFLQSRGHVWDADRQRSTRPGPQIIGVVVPGDPAYEGAAA